ncbi:unnamed protein product [Cylindrotheca closterium]|uniref:Uncharacterized protein n=1 Tax=Cylindrotheca closterium TaxID=2856 RepID=A0AAD2FT84_9STRA|nr:unnamed protein product [Cylindrotheca closterium]
METLDIYVKGAVEATKTFEQDRGDMAWDTRDNSHLDSPTATPGKRKSSDCDRQPESPLEIERQHAPNTWRRNKEFTSMETDSPASYPKHIMASSDSSDRFIRGEQYDLALKETVSTPILSNEHGSHGEFERPTFRPSNHYSYNEACSSYSTPPQHRNFLHDDHSQSYGLQVETDSIGRPRRWACDYCQFATFLSYEEACAHEELCARQYTERYGSRPHISRGPIPRFDTPLPAGHQQGRVGTLYHATHEVPGPPIHMWNSQGPPLPPLRDPIYHGHHHPHQSLHSSHHSNHRALHSPHDYHQISPRYHGYGTYGGFDTRDGNGVGRLDYFQKPQKARLLLAMPTDSDSLSDRQCYVRSEMVEIFAATGKDVAARHSKGAQKLVAGQVGIRCVHCAHLRPRDRAERAVCYPSSISRIYQTVADMQRFHFEQCREIPPDTRKIYKSLKTTRPRGVGSPQTYWVQSAMLLNLIDTENGIRFTGEVKNEEEKPAPP